MRSFLESTCGPPIVAQTARKEAGTTELQSETRKPSSDLLTVRENTEITARFKAEASTALEQRKGLPRIPKRDLILDEVK